MFLIIFSNKGKNVLGQVAEGTSRYGSGMLGLFRPWHERKIVQYCIHLYQKLQVSRLVTRADQCYGFGFVLDLHSEDFWIRIRIPNTDPDPDMQISVKMEVKDVQ